jgi:hypothetical protein
MKGFAGKASLNEISLLPRLKGGDSAITDILVFLMMN